MNKKALFVMVILILTLTLLPITPTIAVGPRPKAKADVTVTGDIYGSAWNLDVGLHGKLTIVYGDVNLNVDSEFVIQYPGEDDCWGNFVMKGRLGIRIDKRTGEVHIIYMFDEYEDEDKFPDGGKVPKRFWGAKKYQLETDGTFSGSITDGTVEIANEFEIQQIVYHQSSKKNGKGAFGVTYPIVLEDVYITFTIEIKG